MKNKIEEGAKWLDLFGAKHLAASLVLIAGIILHATDTYITATMLPLIVSDIGGIEFYAWNTSLFITASIIMAAITGKILNKLGAQKSFILAGFTFMAGCLIAAFAETMPTFLLGRIVQGAGGGMIFTLCYAMIIFAFPQRLWSLAFALLSGVWGIATLFGPAIGGVFAEIGQWRLGFVTLTILAVLFVILAVFSMPKVEQFDDDGNIPFTRLLMLGLIIISLSIGNVVEEDMFKFVGVILGLSIFALFIWREKKSGVRLFPKGIFDLKNPLFLSFLVIFTLIFCINVEFFVPFYMQNLHEFSPLAAGYLTAMVAVGWTGSELFFAKHAGDARIKLLKVAPYIMPVSLILLAIFVPQYEATNYSVIISIGMALFLLGISIGSVWPHLASFALQFTPKEEQASSASILSMIQMFALAFGAAIAGLVTNLSGFNLTDQPEMVANSALYLFGVFALIALLACIASNKLIVHIKASA